jgi:iron complex outermembrane receptor protein
MQGIGTQGIKKFVNYILIFLSSSHKLLNFCFMTIQRLLARKASLAFICVLFTLTTFSQTKTITGKILDDKGAPVIGASITVKGSKSGSSSHPDGTFQLTVPSTATTLVISSVGFASQEVAIGDQTTLSVSLVPSQSNLNEVVVIGYGSSRRSDITGAVASVKAKDFNSGALSPEQLMTGKITGVQVADNSGAPGTSINVKIRGNNTISSSSNPLYVVDGVPLDATSPIAPDKLAIVGTVPAANGLIFLDPGNIASLTVLKDASASAIYGARGENGVILIETNKGNGKTQVDAGVRLITGAGLMKQPDLMNASQYRSAIAQYGIKTDSGASIDPFKSIIQNKASEVYSVGISSGGENGRFRASFSATDQNGYILKSALKRYIATIAGDHSFLDKRLKIGFNIAATQYTLQTAPASAEAGSDGNLISAALQWNPTLNLVENGTFNQTNPSGQMNPLALSKYYDSYAYVTQILGNTNVSLKITKNLSYNFLYGINYAQSTMVEQVQGLLVSGGGNTNYGEAQTGSANLTSQTITHTLTWDQTIKDNFRLNVLAGYEYYSSTGLQDNETYGFGFTYNVIGGPQYNIPYYKAMQTMNQVNLQTNTDAPATAELQSYFGRVRLTAFDKYSLTATVRDDGSNKLGANNKYGVFPAIGVGWDIMKEGFMAKQTIFSNLALRIGWGQTGGTDAIPNPGFQTSLATLQSYGSPGVGPGTATQNYGNASLRWETLTSTDGGIDFGILDDRLTGNIDLYNKSTTNPLFPGTLPVPSSGATIWQNLPGKINNKGFEIGLNGRIIQTRDFHWNLIVNFSYNKNKYIAPALGSDPLFLTGNIAGNGVSATYVQAIANNQPIDAYYLRTWTGYDQNGISEVKSQGSSFVGDPNPHYILGLNTELGYKKFTLTINSHGAFGFDIYNNTLLTVTNLQELNNGKNAAKSVVGTGESMADPVSASTRYLEKGNFIKLGNAMVSYTVGNFATFVKNARVFVSANNLFEITKYHGLDAEVNSYASNGGVVPSLNVDYIGYPTFRTVTFGINFSLN